jgi:heterodisulfide reductase subunit B
VTVTHLVRFLYERRDPLRARVERPLSMRVAMTNPCQVFRPGDQMGFDDPMLPRAMRCLIELTGAEVTDYVGQNECCGATLYLADPALSYAAGKRKLEAVQEADVLVHACGNCQLLLGHFQPLVLQGDRGLRKQTLFLPQLLGLALGLPPRTLGIREALR